MKLLKKYCQHWIAKQRDLNLKSSGRQEILWEGKMFLCFQARLIAPIKNSITEVAPC